MRPDDVVRELGDEGAIALLQNATLVRLAYSGLDGSPRVVPVGFLWTHGAIVICTAVTAPKVAALRERPDVALTIDIGDTPANAEALLLRGTASLDVVDGVPAEYLAAVAKALPADAATEFEASARQVYERMVRIRVVPTWARYYDFGAGRMPRFLSELAGDS
jgi:Pyridoxamine 5'-phosphate oxidase